MRSQIVKVNEKDIEVKVLRKKELTAIVNDFKNKEDTKKLKDEQILNLVNKFVNDNLIKFVPELKEEDIDNAYIDEIENLVVAIIDVNFTGIKNIIGFVGKDLIKNILQNFLVSVAAK